VVSAHTTKLEGIDTTVVAAIAAAKSEADTNAQNKANAALASAKSYADTAEADAVNTAKAYTDGEIDKVESTIAGLHTIATSGKFTDLEDMSADTTNYVILNCGTSSLFI
jgi:hypothetical protein